MTAERWAPEDLPADLDEHPDLIGKSLAAFLAESTAGVRYFVPNMIPEGALVAVLGRPETFKTFAMMQLGLAGAGGPDWLGLGLGDRRPFLYVSNEKSPATVRERLRRMTADAPPVERVHIIHRRGVTFGDRHRWGEVLAVAADLGRPFAVCDTLASLTGPGFNENDGSHMAVALGALRQLTDLGATVALLHHPAKYGEGTGGIRLRGHTSLWGEVDSVVQLTREDRSVPVGTLRAEPKDGELQVIGFRWSAETFLIEADTSVRILTARTIAEIVDTLYEGEPLSADAIRARFPKHSPSRFAEVLSEAMTGGLVARVGAARSTRYLPSGKPFFGDNEP